jgi:predicted DNA binding CopG/RHH family protein
MAKKHKDSKGKKKSNLKKKRIQNKLGNRNVKKEKNHNKIIAEYDQMDTSSFIDHETPLTFEELGYQLPEVSPTQVVSIRLPTYLLNEIKALGSKNDIPYQALIKLFLARAIKKEKKESA